MLRISVVMILWMFRSYANVIWMIVFPCMEHGVIVMEMFWWHPVCSKPFSRPFIWYLLWLLLILLPARTMLAKYMNERFQTRQGFRPRYSREGQWLMSLEEREWMKANGVCKRMLNTHDTQWKAVFSSHQAYHRLLICEIPLESIIESLQSQIITTNSGLGCLSDSHTPVTHS
jgi:hypothetical protein